MEWFYVACYVILRYVKTAERPGKLSPNTFTNDIPPKRIKRN